MVGGDLTLPVSQPNFTIDPATNRITNSVYTYDATGNMTHDANAAYAYDGANRLININTAAYLGDIALLSTRQSCEIGASSIGLIPA